MARALTTAKKPYRKPEVSVRTLEELMAKVDEAMTVSDSDGERDQLLQMRREIARLTVKADRV